MNILREMLCCIEQNMILDRKDTISLLTPAADLFREQSQKILYSSIE